jgi:chorismate synthase
MKYIAIYLTFAMFILGIVPRVDAGFVTSEIITHQQIDRTADLQKIQKVIETKIVRERLENLGFTQDEIQTRISQLSDEQIHNLALNLDQLKVGGDGLGVVVALLVIALLVVVIVYLTKHRVIVK